MSFLQRIKTNLSKCLSSSLVYMGLAAFAGASFGLPREQVLSDPLNRISDSFAVPEALRDRTRFWFDVYTRWDSNTHVFHHRTYPWIVFDVIDTNKIITSSPGNFWQRYFRAQGVVEAERKRIAKTLDSLSKRKSYANLKGHEKKMFDALRSIPGRRQLVFRQARENLRSQLGQKDFFVQALVNSRKYMTYMEQEFQKHGLPRELVRLPIVESSFNEKARSKVGASGIWQIMPATGKAYGVVNEAIDERNSPLKATRIAAVLIKKYHRSLEEWPLTITAYNHGIGSLLKAVKKLRTSDLAKIIADYRAGSFGFASSNFFTSFLAAMYAEIYHDKIFTDQQLRKARLVVREVVKLDRSLRLNDLARLAQVSRDQLLEYNRDLLQPKIKNVLLPRGYELHLPVGHRRIFNAELEKERSQKMSRVESKRRSG